MTGTRKASKESSVAPDVSPSTEEQPSTGPHAAEHAFVLQKVQPALLGLMDGSVSTLAPLFTAAGLATSTHRSTLLPFFIGLAASLGAAISMGLAEALSDDGKVTGRGGPWGRGIITGVATAVGGMLHTFPFLIPHMHTALVTAYVVVVIELLAIAYIRYHFMKAPLLKTIVQVIVGGFIVFLVGMALGQFGGA
jgi:VIT1/CCC1 family predicted Fe2+/Mn2+ transporter